MFVLATVSDGEIEINHFPTQVAAEDALLCDLYETFKGYKFPKRYDTALISSCIAEYDLDYFWKIQEV